MLKLFEKKEICCKFESTFVFANIFFLSDILFVYWTGIKKSCGETLCYLDCWRVGIYTWKLQCLGISKKFQNAYRIYFKQGDYYCRRFQFFLTIANDFHYWKDWQKWNGKKVRITFSNLIVIHDVIISQMVDNSVELFAWMKTVLVHLISKKHGEAVNFD